mmetsp:Transcript_37089/g.75640  ORF Transcript_37089/g.75640 Transcript_37089/m.75640 type:complete len:118 (+) Transcript_37089:1621-1974(+)
MEDKEIARANVIWNRANFSNAGHKNVTRATPPLFEATLSVLAKVIDTTKGADIVVVLVSIMYCSTDQYVMLIQYLLCSHSLCVGSVRLFLRNDSIHAISWLLTQEAKLCLQNRIEVG